MLVQHVEGARLPFLADSSHDRRDHGVCQIREGQPAPVSLLDKKASLGAIPLFEGREQ